MENTYFPTILPLDPEHEIDNSAKDEMEIDPQATEESNTSHSQHMPGESMGSALQVGRPNTSFWSLETDSKKQSKQTSDKSQNASPTKSIPQSATLHQECAPSSDSEGPLPEIDSGLSECSA